MLDSNIYLSTPDTSGTSDASDGGISDTTASTREDSLALATTNDLRFVGKFHSYLEWRREQEFRLKLEETGSKGIVLPVFATPMEKSFNKFIAALARTFIVAQRTPITHTQRGFKSEFDRFSEKIGLEIDLSVPEYDEKLGNLLEIKRMVLTSVLKWMEVWKTPYPEGVSKARLCKDVMKGIAHKAQERRVRDAISLGLSAYKDEVFAYEGADWRETMEQDLKEIGWDKDL
ncbi:hypothetical protein V5O48_006707 [Marasmius crinis-equi]|uniref:Uncharacterized protein n=1 Tax=Marasmius crinis-equi TaxID=585013 RepID=A0ABR3FIS6_9AGAR